TGGLWFGWSGRIVDQTEVDDVHVQQAGPVKLAMVDLSKADHDAFYLGYSNGVLWPVFHYRLDLADFDAGYIAGYRRVNQLFARKLLPLLRPDDVIWVHDYHLIPLAAELRALGCQQRIGFFLHIPLPPPLILAAIPGHDWLIRALFAYDVVGFQSEADLDHFARYVESEAHAQRLPDQRWRAFGRTVHAGAFPIGIDVQEFAELANAREAVEMYERTKREYYRRKLLVGVDRLDYSKGLPQRMRAFREFLDKNPDLRSSATLIQIASPSRENVEAYSDLLHELESLCGSINGNFGDLDWMPVRYIHRTVARARLPGLYKASRVARVTPLRDGMNLGAKEFLAPQDEEDPGVLVLSRVAGAAEQLKEALLVNPYDTEGTAAAILLALQMPLEERRERHQSLMRTVRQQDVHWWCESFLAALAEARAEEKGTSWLRL
ncbi:MAG: trehalose-6-phosphate synthase, partial [Burkholderiales bacterium]